MDKSALGWEHHEKVDKHESQKGDKILNTYAHSQITFSSTFYV